MNAALMLLLVYPTSVNEGAAAVEIATHVCISRERSNPLAMQRRGKAVFNVDTRGHVVYDAQPHKGHQT